MMRLGNGGAERGVTLKGKAGAAALVVASVVVVVPASAKAPLLYSNCAHLNETYPHGLGIACEKA